MTVRRNKNSFECVLLLIDILDRGFVPYSIGEYMVISYNDCLSDLLFSFVFGKYIVCDVYGLESPSFESTTVLCSEPTNNASMQELVMYMQDHKQKLAKTCSCCKNDSWHAISTIFCNVFNILLSLSTDLTI